MRAAYSLFFANLLWTHSHNSASALPNIFARQTCESIVCFPDFDWGSVGGWLDDFTKSIPLGLQTLPKDDLPTIPGGDSPPPEIPSTTPDPDIELFVVDPSPSSKVCTEGPDFDDPNAQGSPDQTNMGPCNGAIPQLIWPIDCQDAGRNAEIGKLLLTMDPGYLTSYDPLCPSKDGVGFWQAQLDPQQIEELRQQTDIGLKAVSPNLPYEFGTLTETQPSPMRRRSVMSSPVKKENLKPRKISLFTEMRRKFDLSIEYLSAPSQIGLTFNYVYFKTFEPKVRVYVMDTGITARYNNLDNVEISWIWGLGATEEPGDDHPLRHGTCMASKIASDVVGVSSNVKLTVVKMTAQLGSFLDALGKVVAAIQTERASNPMEVCVVHISGGYLPDDGDPDMKRLQDLIQELITNQAIVVTSAGFTTTSSKSTIIDHWPAVLAETMDIIAVGGVQTGPTDEANKIERGSIIPGSKGGPALTVRAPGQGYCAKGTSDAKWIYTESRSLIASDFPTAIVSGLVAYFLSIPPLREKLLQKYPLRLPRAMKNYLKFMSRARDRKGEVMSVWNGINSVTYREGEEYTDWVGLKFMLAGERQGQ